jgi:uncharacterized protein YjiS (DUF1127 family)
MVAMRFHNYRNGPRRLYCGATRVVDGTTIMIFASLIASLRARYQTYKAYQARLAAYQMLTDKDLAEIGYSRSDIPDLARHG